MRERSPAPVDTLRQLLALLGISATLALLLALAVGGGSSALALGDPGALVRWGVPLVRLVQDLGAAVTLGLLLFAGYLMPETTATDHRLRALELARWSSLAWAVAALLGVGLVFADTAGVSVASPDFVRQMLTFVWSLETTRVQLIVGVIAASVAVGCWRSRTKVGAARWAAIGLFGVVLLALTGHSAASGDHMNGVNGYAFHLLGATIWVGGMVALALLWTRLGAQLKVTVQRYSTVALWCYGLLVTSGLVLGWIDLGGWSNLASAWGAILLIKAVLAVALGALGWWYRSRVIEHLDSGSAARLGFGRLVLADVALMAVASGLAVALTRTPLGGAQAPPPSSPVYTLTNYPDPGPPGASAWLTDWQVDCLWLPVSLVCIAVYLRWVRRLRTRGDSWPRRRTVLWVLGWAIFAYTLCGAPAVYGRVLFSWHMIQHMSIAMIVPLLLVPAAPITLALRAIPARRDKTLGPREVLLGITHSRYVKFFANPIIAAAMFFFSLAIFYFSPLFALAMSTHSGHVIMVIHFLMSGYFFVWMLVGIDPGPAKWHPVILLVILFVTVGFHAFFGVIITQSSTLLAPEFFGQLQLPWLDSPLDDQFKAGEIAWGIGEVPTLTLAMMVALQFVRRDEREQRRWDRQAARDDDAQLAAYNQQLARLSGPSHE